METKEFNEKKEKCLQLLYCFEIASEGDFISDKEINKIFEELYAPIKKFEGIELEQ